MTELAGVVVDIETTGLSEQEDCILEIAFLAYDTHFQPGPSFSHVISGELELGRIQHLRNLRDTNKDADFVLSMHENNGLLDDMTTTEALPLFAVASMGGAWLRNHKLTKMPMTGSSVHFDRGFLNRYAKPIVREFSHRCIDVSGIREWLRIANPDLAEAAEANVPAQSGNHRALGDCHDTLTLLRSLSGVV